MADLFSLGPTYPRKDPCGLGWCIALNPHEIPIYYIPCWHCIVFSRSFEVDDEFLGGFVRKQFDQEGPLQRYWVETAQILGSQGSIAGDRPHHSWPSGGLEMASEKMATNIRDSATSARKSLWISTDLWDLSYLKHVKTIWRSGDQIPSVAL